jgi:hypothetical protein
MPPYTAPQHDGCSRLVSEERGKIDAITRTPEEEAQRSTERLISGRSSPRARSIFEWLG